MERPEVPLEQAQEELVHHAHESGEKWIMGVALTAALLAVFAAITSLIADHHAEEAMILQIKCADEWNYYQAKGIKENLLRSKIELLTALQKPVEEKDRSKLAQYEKDQAEIKAKADKMEEESNAHFKHHTILTPGVTMFQVAIAVGAIAVLTKRRRFWYFSIAFGAVGIFFLLWGLLLA